MECSLCERIKQIKHQAYPFQIHEFEHSYLVLGEHQFFPGYCLLISKSHHREMADIPSPEREGIFSEMMLASKAIQNVMRPKKMNLCSLGNVVEHLHWHFFPRYEEDPEFNRPPWLQMHLFEGAKVTPDESKERIEALRQELGKLS